MRILHRVEWMDLRKGYEFEQAASVRMSGHPDSKEALLRSGSAGKADISRWLARAAGTKLPRQWSARLTIRKALP